MNKFTKIAAGTLAALTITVGALATSSTEAKAWGGKKFGAGIALGLIGTAAFVAATSTFVRLRASQLPPRGHR